MGPVFHDRFLTSEQMAMAEEALIATVAALRGGKHSGHSIEPDLHDVSSMIVEYIMRGRLDAGQISFHIAAHYADERAQGACSLTSALID